MVEEPEPEPDTRTVGYFPGGAAPHQWQLPASWKRPGLYQLTYGLHFNMSLSASLTVVPMGNVTVVHAVPAGGAPILTVSLRPRDYIATTESVDTADRFQNLRQLSNVFKNNVTVPLLVHFQRSVGLVSQHEWRALPLELQLDILRRLPVRDVLRMRSTSREMRCRADDPLLWKDLVFRDFPAASASLRSVEPCADWKQLYAQLFRHRAAEREAEPVGVPLALPSQPWFDPPPLAPPIAGIIGGEYDRLPSLGFNPPLALPRTRLGSLLPAGRRRFGSQVAAPTIPGGMHFF
ncbi:F-box only protein 7-like [Pollicipes pollicipes]|uniref:F-box only protein 7-like n=1 Tax=Pollicipes pollicipes TaxID=41117 RepID=UPI0018857E22|nr:F-box only protein 7-like [Pollicipes pollicipes]